MQLITASLIANPCDDEYDDMALLCCHSQSGELFSLSRFPDEDHVEITVRDDKTHALLNLTVTFSAERLLVELDPADAKKLDGHQTYEILHSTSAGELKEVEETLQLILKGTGTYISQLG